MKETELYFPLKTYFEGQGAQVSGEVGHTDMVVIQGSNIFGIELKLRFSLALVYQMLSRRGAYDGVYAAVPFVNGGIPNRKNVLMLLSSLGFGLIGIEFLKTKTLVRVVLQCNKKYSGTHGKSLRRERILREIDSRYAELSPGGMDSSHKRLTAYRQQALHIAWLIDRQKILGKTKILREQGGPAKTPSILQDNLYGWFVRVARGTYSLSSEGQTALVHHSEDLKRLEPIWLSYLSRSLQ